MAMSQRTGGLEIARHAMKAELLDAETERDLAVRWRDHQDARALHRLVTAYMRLAVSVAAKFRRYGAAMPDLIQEANIGLLKAASKFDPDRGVRFSTYAVWWIKASIQEYILRSWSLVKLGTTSAQKKLFFNLRKAKAKIGALEEGDLRPENVAKIASDLNVTESEVISMNRRMGGGGDASLNAQVGGADGEGAAEWQDWLADEDAELVINGVSDLSLLQNDVVIV